MKTFVKQYLPVEAQDNFFNINSFSGLPVVLPDQMEAVLLGAAVLGACASQDYSSIQVEWHTQLRS